MLKIRGFTLIELMVVIAIIATLAMLAFPSFEQQIKKNKFNRDAKDLVSLLVEGRSQAVLLRREVTVNFSKTASDVNTSTNLYWDPKVAQITTPTNVVFDMLGRVKSRPTNGCVTVSHKSDASYNKKLTLGIFGSVESVEDGQTC